MVLAEGGEAEFVGGLVTGVEEDCAGGEFDNLDFVRLIFGAGGDGFALVPGFAIVVADCHVDEPTFVDALVVGNDDSSGVFAFCEDDTDAGAGGESMGFGVFDLGGEVGGFGPGFALV